MKRFLILGLIVALGFGINTFSREAIIDPETGEIIVELSQKTSPQYKGGPYQIGQLSINYEPLQAKPLYLACDPACTFKPYKDGFVLRVNQK